MEEARTIRIPARDEVEEQYKWDLAALFADGEDWEREFEALKKKAEEIPKFKGTLGRSASELRICLDFMRDFDMLAERLMNYAYLRQSEDLGNSKSQERYARLINAISRAEAASSYQTPEIQAIPDEIMNQFLAGKEIEPYRIMLYKLLRFKPHVLSEPEEKILALQMEANETAQKAFGALTNVDLNFGEIETGEGLKPLTQSTLSTFLIDPDRETRKKAYLQFYQGFDSHKNTIAALYAGSVNLDIYKARVRNYPSARNMALFPDKVDEVVYDNLVATVHANFPVLHRYYELRKKALGVDELRHYDVYVPLVKNVMVKHSFEEAARIVLSALSPLGKEYGNLLEQGFADGWVDRYENRGKRSGAFSFGVFSGKPYILMNFKDVVLDDVFTLAHEAGHSMHSWYSIHNNPFQHYHYTIFEAEVASTFNEQLLMKYFLDLIKSGKMKTTGASDKDMEIYLLGKQVDKIIATLIRQTMFAEFEHRVHALAESGEALTVDCLREEYRKLLETYFGPSLVFEQSSDLEGLRIPHFYRAFYVYKYATGLSAGIALADRVLKGGERERADYLGFLKSGGSRYPLESLKLAGVDMSSPEPVQKVLTLFDSQVRRLEELGSGLT